MKKILLLLVAITLSSIMFAQDKKVTELKVNQLPKSVSDWVTKNFPGAKIARAGKIEEKGVISYAAVVESKGKKHSYIFDNDGKLIGKGDNLFKGNGGATGTTKTTGPSSAPAGTKTDPKQPTPPVSKPPVKTPVTKPAPPPPATIEAAPKK